jgi:CRISPR system Cascade subunit CasE
LFQEQPEKKRDFLFRQDSYKGLPVFYIQSQTEPKQTVSALKVETKPFDPQLNPGDRLRFTLRANPVAQTRLARSPDEQTALAAARLARGLREKTLLPQKRIRHDVVMQLKTSLSAAEKEQYSEAELVQQSGLAWLARKAENLGFKLLEASAEGYQQHHFKKRGIKISTIDFNGVLEVTDPPLFIQALYNGIGPAKAFGCGLLSVARA